MKILQKIEFWFFSVPALVVAIGGIAHYGAWRALWAFPVCFTLAAVIRFLKTLVIDLVDEPRIRACRSGRWPLAYGLILPIALYDWLAVALAVDLTTLLIVWRYHAAMPGWLVVLCVYAASFAVPSLIREVQGRSDGGYGIIMTEAERLMLLAAIPLAAFVGLTPVRFALYTIPFGIVALGWIFILWYVREHAKFTSIWEGEKAGRPWRRTADLRWFPRPGVVYEPRNAPDGISARLGKGDWEKAKAAMTVLRVSPVAFLSLALLVGGAAMLVDRGRGLALFAALAGFALWFLHSGFIGSEKWGGWFRSLVNSAPYSFCYLCLGALIAWLGGGERIELIAVAAFLVGCFEFPTRHILRASSDRNPDWWRFVCTLLAAGITLWARSRWGCAWYVCAICATCASYPYVLARHFWPPKPLAGTKEANVAQPGAVSGDSGKKERRNRKRERQMAAFRRSKGA